MSDPLTDPRCEELVNAQCGAISEVAGAFATLSQATSSAGGSLVQAADGAHWSGSAYDVMHSSVGTLTPHLEAISVAFQDVSNALSHYEGVISNVQSEFNPIKAELEYLERKLQLLDATFSEQQASLSTAKSGKAQDISNGADAATITSDKSAIHSAASALDGTGASMAHVQNRINELQPKGMYLLERFSDAREHAHGKISQTTAEHPKPPGGFNPLRIAGDVVKVAGTVSWDTVKDIGSIPDDVKDAWDHPDLKNLEKLFTDVAVAAGTFAGGLGAGALLTGAVEGTAEEAGATVVGRVLSTATSAASKGAEYAGEVGARAGVATTATELAQGNVKGALVSEVTSKLPDVGQPEVDAAKAAKVAAEKVAAEKDAEAVAANNAAKESENPLDPEQQAALDKANQAKQDADEVAKQKTEAYEAAEHKLNSSGRVVDLGRDRLVVDPTEKLVDHAIGAGDSSDSDGSGGSDDKSGNQSLQSVAAAL